MIQPFISQLALRRIILASSSPRRQSILQNIGIDFEVVPSLFEENLDVKNFASPIEFVKETAKQKALEVAKRLQNDQVKPDLIIGADTIVTLDNEIFGKPKSKEDAFNMLNRLSGRSHEVYTGVILILPQSGMKDDEKLFEKSFHEGTEVIMAAMTPEIIRAYVETNEPMDKAGAYGIQGIGGTLVEGIHGDYFNVMGFPLHKFCKEIYKLCKDRML